jgi:maltose alpha-D-glucosyltransferase/alpha-amylase
VPKSSAIVVAESFEALVQNPEALYKSLSPWLATRRWSGLGGHEVTGIEVLDWVTISSRPSSTVFAAMIQMFPPGAEAAPEVLYVPLQVCFGPASNGCASARSLDREFLIREGEYSTEYNDFLLKGLACSQVLQTSRGRLSLRPFRVLSPEAEVVKVEMLGGGDTTNVVVKSQAEMGSIVVKTYKKISESNPEPEMLSALSNGGFRNIPKIVGDMSYIGADRGLALTIMQELLESQGGGDEPFAKNLRDEIQYLPGRKDQGPSERLARRVGAIIASMHHVLGKSTMEGFGASAITSDVIRAWENRVDRLFRGFLGEASADSEKLGAFVSSLVAALSSGEGSICECLSLMTGMVGMKRIRTHQDLHLSQLLVVRGDDGEDDFFVVDFEGDPQRGGGGRREKECPLRDLGTMARSFSYLRYNVLGGLFLDRGYINGLELIASAELRKKGTSLAKTPPLPQTMDEFVKVSRQWEKTVRGAMIEGYLVEAERLGDHFLSVEGQIDSVTVDSVTRFWEMEKALLEARYELHHRPQYLIIPLAGFLALC